ncbi:MAG: hypothetical protein K2N91_07725 [Muribaculaceae bacterium]|nr:hypothetical protein [Muribaculaceae bacterium]
MELDDIQKQWSELNRRINKIDDKLSRMSIEKNNTALDWLANKYKWMAIFVAPIGILTMILGIELFGTWICVSYCLYFLIADMMDLYLYRKVKKIDPTTMSISEVSHMAQLCRRRHHQFQLILIPLAIALVSALVYHNLNDANIVISMAIGAGLGLLLGTILYLRMMKRYRILIDQEQ